MDALIAHLTANKVAYICVLVCALPLAIIFRRYTVKAAAWSLEAILYTAGLHVALHVFLGLVRWFKMNTVMHALEKDVADPGWHTPLIQFWNQAAYTPSWIYYLELVAFIFFICLVLYLRPMKIQKVKERAIHPARSDVRPAYRHEAR
jgi:hypothetical protein